jgi:hypothetical protein
VCKLAEGKKNHNVLMITLGVVGAIVGLIESIGLFQFRPKCWEQISRIRGSKIAKSFSVHLINLYLVNCSLVSLRKMNRHLVNVFTSGEG